MEHNQESQLGDVLRWALESTRDRSWAWADWLARDIDPDQNGAVSLLTNAKTSPEKLEQAKSVFKTMRVIGQTASDRQLGARLYLCSIAAALVHHDTRISSQSNSALHKGLVSLSRDEEMPDDLRDLADLAMALVRDKPQRDTGAA